MNYLRILGAKELFPRAISLLNDFVVKLEDVDKQKKRLVSIQFYGTFLVRKPFPISQLKEMLNFFFLDDTLPISQKAVDFLFPVQQISI